MKTVWLRCLLAFAGTGALFAAAPVPQIEWIAHRGESREATENTLAAFDLSLKNNADGIECDIRLTADRKIVCFHDPSTGRLAGVDRKIRETDFDALRELKLKGKNRYGIPLLRNVLALLSPGKRIYIEIKSDETVIPDLLRMLDHSGIENDRIVILSFRRAVVKAFKAAAPDRTALWLYRSEPGTRPDGPTLLRKLEDCGADGIDLYYGDATPELIRLLKRNGMFCAVWTVDSESDARRMAEYGADAITSNRAAALRQSFLSSVQ